MAEIQEYTPQVEAQGAVGGTSPNLELAGGVGRAVERLGGAIEQGGNEIYRKQAQEETANTYAAMADQRQYWTNEIQTRTQNGTLDVDKLKDEFENSTSNLGDNISTAEGKNYFTRQQARLKGHILQMAQSGAATLASNQAKASWQQGVDSSSAAILSNPSSFEDTYNAGLESIDSLISTGGLPEKMRDTAVRAMGQEYARAAVHGWNKIDPDMAKKMLDDGKLDKVGGSDFEILNGDLKNQLYGEIQTAKNAKEIEASRVELAKERASKAQFNSLMNGANGQPGWYDRIDKGTLSTQEVMNTPGMGWEQKALGLEMIKRANQEKTGPTGTMYTEAWDRIHDLSREDNITDDQQLIHEYPKLPPNELKALSADIVRSPEGQLRAAKEMELKASANTLLFNDNMTGRTAPESKELQKRFMMEYQQEKVKFMRDGKDPDELLDRNSPNYFGYKVGNYQIPPDRQMEYLAKTRTDRALKQQGPPNPPAGTPAATGQPPPDVIGQTPGAAPAGPGGVPPATGPTPSNPPPAELNWWEPHPTDSPEVAQNRAMNAATRKSLMDGLDSLKSSPITKGIFDSLRGTHELTNALQKGKPSDIKKTLGDRAWRPDDTIESYNARNKINLNGPMGPVK